MEAVKAFNEELSGIYETKPPISRAKMTQLTKKAIKGIKFYKHIVQSMEKFVQKCRPEYKVPGLYVIDSVVRQSRHQFGPEKDVFMPRLCKNILTTFQHIYKCPPEDKPRILRVLNLWQKNTVFPQDIVQQLTVMGGAPTPDVQSSTSTASNTAQKSSQPDPANLTNLLANLLANPDTTQIQNLAGLLSSSQQNQLEDLLKQVKGSDQQNHQEPIPPPPSQPNNSSQTNVFQPSQKNVQPPFLHSKAPEVERQQPAFNRDVLDFDYSDDEQTPPSKAAKHSHGIDPSLLAKLPTADQIQQLTAPQHSGMPPKNVEADSERLKILEQEQEIFNKQIQQMSNDMNDRGGSSQRSDHRRKRSRSRSHDRHHRHHRRRSHSRDRHRSRRSRSRDRSRRSRRSRSRSVEKRRDKNGFPPIRDGCISVCTTTLWIGNISAKVMQHELQAMVEEYGEVESINMIPPRGCAYVCMKKRVEADRALQKIRHSRLAGKSLKCDWAPSKEMPESQKPTWVKEHGVNYVLLTADADQLRSLSSWGCIDPESVPEHRRDELNPPTATVTSNPPMSEVIEQPKPPQMVQTFNPAPGMMPNVAMVARPQMSTMMVRPFQVNPYGMPQRMGFQPQPAAPQDSKADTNMEMGNTTPTADEQTDEAPPPQSMPQFQAPYGAVSVAQRFPGAMPVQLRMMPNMGQQIMPQRMGVMPIRMGIPMQLRPGFHPGMQARISMPGGPQMLPNQMHPSMQQLQPPRMPSQQPMNRFPGGIRMAMPGQMPMRMPSMPPADGFRPSGPPTSMPERQLSNSSVNGMPDHARLESHPPNEIIRPPHFDPPREFESGLSNMGRPLPDAGRPTQDVDKPQPHEMDRSLQDLDRPPRDMDRPPRDMDRPPRDMDRPPRDMDRPPRDMDRPPRDMDRPPRDMDRPPRDMDRPPRDIDRPPRDGNHSGSRDRRDYDRNRRERSRDRDRRDRDMDRDRRGGRDYDRGRRDSDRGGRDFDRRGRGPPPFRGRPFRGHNDRGDRGWGRGGDRGGFRGRGRGGGGPIRGDRRRSPEIDSEEEEYQRKRKETLRKRHEQEDEYVAEQIDYSAFGLPSGFGGAPTNADPGAQEKDDSSDKNDQSSKPPGSTRAEGDDAAESRKAWLDEQNKKRDSAAQSPSNSANEKDTCLDEHPFAPTETPQAEGSVPDQKFSPEPAVEFSSVAADHSSATDNMKINDSPGTPTVDEQCSQIIEEEEVYLPDSSGTEQSSSVPQESIPTNETESSTDAVSCQPMDES